MSNQIDVHTAPGHLTISAFDIDDQVNIWIDGNKVWGDGSHPISRNQEVKNGDSFDVRFELYNMSGGRYHAEFAIAGPSGTIYSHTPDGFGGPQNIVFSESVHVTCRS